jgi:hypothetical protein
MSEYKLYSRLKSLRENQANQEILKPFDIHELFAVEVKQFTSIDDILDEEFDDLDIFDDDTQGLFDFKHTPKDYQRASADFTARRKPCKNFSKYEEGFKSVHRDLENGQRKLIDFKEDNLIEGNYYLHNGILMLLEAYEITKEEETLPEGKRVRKDGRTYCVFENGTESNMLYRSVAKALYANGKIVSPNTQQAIADQIDKFNNVQEDDTESGYIYILKSLSEDKDISSIENLYKIGFSTTTVEKRILNARNDPTYLMAPVEIITSWKCYNLNAHQFEQLIHRFFGNSCLNVEITDKTGKKANPREWFIVPLDVIEQAIQLVITGDILDYRYDEENQLIVSG